MERDKLIEIRNRLYDNLPKGEVCVFDLIKVIKEHLTELDLLIDSLTAPVPDGKVTDEDIQHESVKRASKVITGHKEWTQINALVSTAFTDGAKWMRDKLTKTPDAG